MRLRLGVLLGGLLLAGCKEKCEELPMSAAQPSLAPDVALAIQNTASAAGGKVCKAYMGGVAVFGGQMAAAFEALDDQMEKNGWGRSSQDKELKGDLFQVTYKPKRQSSLSIHVEIHTNKGCAYGDVCMRFMQNGVPP
jgi:hypothetical protein